MTDISAGSPRLAEDLVRRALVVLGLLGIALIHLLDLPSTIKQTPYLGALYIVLIAAALGAAEMLVRADASRRWQIAGLIALAPLTGYMFSRSTGLPYATDDIGNWLDPLGLASLFVEGVVALLVATTLLLRGGPRET